MGQGSEEATNDLKCTIAL